MDEKLVQEVKAVVESIFSQKEEAKMREKTEAELSRAAATIDDLTVKLDTTAEEASKKDATISELQEKISKMEGDLEKASKELEGANEKLEVTHKTLEDMKKDKAADDRMSVLERAGVTRSDKDAQKSKIREMSDEEFAAYKDELVALRASVIKELEVKTPEKAEEGDAETASSEEESVITPPAKVDPKETASNVLNMEVASKDIKDKYKSLGEALAKRMLGKTDSK